MSKPAKSESSYIELIFPKPFAYCREVKNLAVNNENVIRIYKDTPDTLQIQIRTFGPITDSRTGAKRNMIAGSSMTKNEAIAFKAKLEEFIASCD